VVLEGHRIDLVVQDWIGRNQRSVVDQYAQSAPLTGWRKQIAKKMEQRASKT
jgi:hypothetical protein